MNRRLLTILLVAFLIASGCTFLVYRVVGSKAVAAKPIVTVSDVAAAADIKARTTPSTHSGAVEKRPAKSFDLDAT